MRTLRNLWVIRALVVAMALSLGWLQVGPAWGGTTRQNYVNRLNAKYRLAEARRASLLAPGLTQTPDAALMKKIEARKRAEAAKPVADVRSLTAGEMGQARGRGALRNPYFNGTLPWQRSLRDVNLCDGNLFKSFTDVQVAPARGAGLVLQRTYNSNDAREGAFGVGWSHAYDIRIQEEANVAQEAGNSDLPVQPVSGAASGGGLGLATSSDAINEVPRTDFFGAKHTYHRDADGLYSPPPYLYDEMSSDYDASLVNGPLKVDDDTDKGMDGTVKHYASVLTLADGTDGNERGCVSITDRYGNVTVLAYGQSYAQPDGSVRRLLTTVTDPVGRQLTFHWSNFGTNADPHYRIVQVDAPTDPGTGSPAYSVAYAYYGANEAGNGGSAYELKSVTMDAGDSSHLNRTTTYTSFTGTYYDASQTQQTATENGLLASVTDPLGHTVSYTYNNVITAPGQVIDGDETTVTHGTPTGTIWVTGVTEPAGVDAGGSPRTLTWAVAPGVAFNSGGGAYFGTAFYTGDLTSNTGTGLCATLVVDSRLRSYGMALGGPGVYLIGTYQAPDFYDDNNDVLQQHNEPGAEVAVQDGNGSSYRRTDVSAYGQHGNVTAHSVNGFSGAEQTAYYNASQYFQKQSVTDMNGHSTTMSVGASTAGSAGDPDTNPGDKGQVLGVRDAGYNDANSPSYHKEFDYTYNQWGQKLTETNMNGVTTAYTYGTSGADTGNLVQVVQDPGGSGHLNRTTAMHYDVMGRVLNSTAPSGLTSSFTYNSLGQPLTVVTPARGGVAGETITYAYDANGRTRSVTDARGTTTMAYEAGSDRVHSVTDPVTGTTAYTYGPTGERLAMALPGGGTWSYAYRPYAFGGGITIPKDDPNAVCRTLLSVTDDQNRTVTVNQGVPGDNSGNITDNIGQTRLLAYDFAYDAQGNVASYCATHYYFDRQSYAGGDVNSVNTRGWLQKVRTTFYAKNAQGQWVSRILSQNEYAYDTSGQRLTNTVSTQPLTSGGVPQTDTNGNPVLTARTEAYTYDALNRLKTVSYGDGESQSYGFDPMGNRLSKSDTVGSSTTTTGYAFDAANRLTATTGAGAATYASDSDGNTLTDGTRTNTWDSQNRLVQCNAIDATNANERHQCSYTYGADGLRRSQAILNEITGGVTLNGHGGQTNGVDADPIDTPNYGDTTDYAYDGTMLTREMKTVSGSLTPTATYLQGPSGPLYRRDDTQAEGTYTDGTGTHAAGRTRWYVSDGLGSVVGEVDPSGNLTASGTFDVYGAKRAGGSTGTATTRQGFVGSLGHVSDGETGLVYMRARYYDPGIGRFVSEDPSRNGNNWFNYANNNPPNEVDADGEVAAFICAAVVGAFAGLGVYLENCVYSGTKPTWEGAGKAAALGAIMGLIAFALFSAGGAMLGLAELSSFANMAMSPLVLVMASTIGFFGGMLGVIAGHTLGVAVTGYFIEMGLALAATDPDCPDIEASM